MRCILSLFLYIITLCALQAQLTLRVTSVPANTPANGPVYVTGSFNNWQPGSSTHQLTKGTDGVYSITLQPPVGTVEYKFTRGSWATVEGNASGAYLPNRTLTYNGTATTVNLTIQSWEATTPSGGTAASNVSILQEAFYMPQLNRYRRIWLYLPPDYATSTKKYPVLYMHDGQNLFDANTSFSGEWEVDESLNELFAAGDYGCIVVGIDNSDKRIDEYSPWVNPQYGGGEGSKYMDFIVETLKPHIDSNFRTQADRQHTAIGGSSLGALISHYGAIEHQDVFSKALLFSPAFWFGGNSSVSQVETTGKQADMRAFFLAGGSEPASVATNMQAVITAMEDEGFTATDLKKLVVAGGEHSEWFWRQEFADAYKWLFATTSNTKSLFKTTYWRIAPNPTREYLRVTGLPATASFDYQIYGTNGQLWNSGTIGSKDTIQVNQIPAGNYVLRLRSKGNEVWVKPFVRL